LKVTFVGHASILVETAGVTVLSDPWWRGPCFGAQWWTYPAPFVAALDDGQRIDYIYISHGHHDHFHPGTLATLPRTAKVLVSSAHNLGSAVRALGFAVVEVHPDEAVRLGDAGLEVRILPTHGDDTLMALADGREVCINLNDALHSAPAAVQASFIKRLRTLYPKIDYVFCGYGVASHFPNCYRIPGKDDAATAARRQAYFNRQWVHVIAGLAPRYGFPFAADVVLLQHELFWANEATHNPERPTTVFAQQHPNSATQVIDIAPGFQIADGRVVSERKRQPVLADRLRKELSEQIERANNAGQVDDGAIGQVRDALDANLSNCRSYLATFPHDYTVVLRFVNAAKCLVLRKRGTDLSLVATASEQVGAADMYYTTRCAYLRWALQRPYGDELLFVGSGGIFEYGNREMASRALHRELISLIGNQPMQRRRLAPADQGLLTRVKQQVKRMLGRSDRDLYDLLGWTVFR
jgi:L-ascorbate metabolism protein UlaG (beta-lactamase superfamily)